MFWLRRWRRIHLPLLFLIYGCSSLFLLSKVSPVSTVTPPDDTRTPHISHLDIDSGIMKTMGQDSVEDELGGDMSVETDSSEDSSSPVLDQLPFCGGRKQVKRSTFEKHFSPSSAQGQNGSSEEVVLSGTGRHIVVATLDGRVSLLDSFGKILWSVCTGHFFSSTISSLQLSERGKLIKLIPSLTGGLYKYDGINLEAMPMNADSLLRRSFKLAQDVVITGGKEFRTFGVDVESGIVRYECGMGGCVSPTTAEAPQVTTAENSSGIVLVIKKALQTVRAIDSLTGTERWNFSVGTHELALAGAEGCYEGTKEQDAEQEQIHRYKMIIPEGVVFGTDEHKQVLWKHKFESPISQAWTLEDSNLEVLDPITSHGLVDDPPSLYVGMHRQQLYVQESAATARRLLGLMALEEANNSQSHLGPSNIPLQISWKPSTTRTMSSVVDPNGDSRALSPLYSAPFFVYEREAVLTAAPSPLLGIEPPRSFEEEEEIEEVNNEEEEDSVVDATVIMAVATFWFWWKEILGISLLTGIIMNIILLRPVVYLTRRRTIAEVIHQVNLFLRRNREQQQLALPAPPPSLEPSASNSTLEVVSPDSTQLRLRTVSTSSAVSSHSDDQSVPFVSQYLKEFEPVQYIGKGAFGTVFEAKKKIDDRSYAVKRITLPNREKSRDRVMREVKALARLDHKNIVRYFNAWIEHPPTGWLEKNDPLWNAFTLNTPSPTCDIPSSSDVRLHSNGFKRKEHSEIRMVDTLEEDSFIVFETESGREGSYSVGSEVKMCRERISEEEEEDSDWSDAKPTQAPLPVPLLSEQSKFFQRPTLLDIPSSTDPTGDECSESEGGSNPGSCVMYLYIQQELCQKRTLQDWLRTESTRRLPEVIGMFLQLVEAVEYIHGNGVIHRDLKPGNIFLAGGSSPDAQMTVKIGDFGLATTLAVDNGGGRIETEAESELAKPNNKLTGQVGTQLYMAPEQALRKAYDHKVDIFSLGLIFFELLVPLSTDMEKHTELHKLRQMKFPHHFIKSHPDQFELIQDMVSHDPNSRPDASEIKSCLAKSEVHDRLTPRSRSYPDHLTNPPSRRNKDKVVYKTHSAM